MKKIIVLILFLIGGLSFGQTLNNFKYALVPEKFDFLKEKNQYQLNDLTKAAMRKYGFESYFVTEILPKDINNENKLYVDVIENSSMIYTKLIIVLRDYTNNILFRSAEGKSKEKDFNDAYNEAFRQAIKSFEVIKHQYSEIKTIDFEKPIINQNENSILIPYSSQKTENGYKLYHGNDGLKFLIYQTSNPNIFIATKTDSQNQTGVLIHKSDGLYSFEYYINNKLFKESINIIF